MGAWSVGMQSNDTALDWAAERSTKELVKAMQDLTADGEYNWLKLGNDGTWAILGVAEALLDKRRGKLLKPFIKEIESAIDSELKIIQNWNKSEERKDALLRFRNRLNGKKVDKIDLIIDNMGLLDKVTTTGMTREDLKKALQPEIF